MCPGQRWVSGVVILAGIFLASWHSAHPEDWLPVQPDDLALKDNPKQPGADAMVLYRQFDVDEQRSTVTEYVRIKIFTQEGARKQGQVEIPYDQAHGESIDAVRGRTIQADGTITDFDGTTSDAVITKARGTEYRARTFAMPNVQPGCVIEFKYRHHYGHLYVAGEWPVQYDLYTRQARFSLKAAASPFYLRSRAYNLFVNNATIERSSKDSYTLVIRDLPGIEDEPLMPSPESLGASVEFYYDLGEPKDETVDGFWKRIGKDWNDQVDHFLDKKQALDAEVSRDVSAGDPAETKLRKLYSHVLKIRNLSVEESKTRNEEKEENIKPNNNVEDVLKHGYGNSLDIDFLMIGLARAAGFDAAEIRVASRNSRLFYPQRRATSDLTSPLVWVRADSKEYYLDPGSHYFPFGVLPWDESAADGIRLTKDGSLMVRTPEPVASNASITRHVALTIDPSMSVSGELHVDFAGLEGAYRRFDNRDDDTEGRKKTLEDEIKGWLPAGSTFEASRMDDWDDVERPIHVEGTLSLSGLAIVAAQRLLMPMDIFQTTESDSFQSERRVNEVDFPYPYQRSDDLVIRTPEGYKVQAVPDADNLDIGGMSYDIWSAQQLDAIEVRSRLTVRDIRYPKEFYPRLRSFFGNVRADDNAHVMFSYAPSEPKN